MIAYDLNKSFQVIRMIQNNEESGEREIPTLVKTIKGRLSSVSGNRSLLYDRESYTSSKRFYCLYDSQIAVSDYIRDIAENKTYKIESMDNPGGENDHLEMNVSIMENGEDLIPGTPWVDPEDGVIDGGYF